jgi:ribosomal protein L11 methyltransferase
MDKFWIVTLFNFQPSREELTLIETEAIEDYKALGVEEFVLDEPEVDRLLGERSYSGGDLPQEVLDEVEEAMMGKPSHYRFFFDQKENAENFFKTLKGQALAESQIEECKTEDWNAEWKKHYAPIKVNSKLEIIPAWMTDYESKTEQKILINPGMGFGTGSHETTFLCLKLFTEEVLSLEVKEALDFGSGSGILGLSVFKFFPNARVDFYDIDPEANKNCFQNAQINDLQDKAFRLLLPEVRDRLQPTYQVVFANILENILILEQNALIEKTASGGFLILSGLLKHQAAGILKIYQDLGMKLVREEYLGDWSALIFRKAP